MAPLCWNIANLISTIASILSLAASTTAFVINNRVAGWINFTFSVISAAFAVVGIYLVNNELVVAIFLLNRERNDILMDNNACVCSGGGGGDGGGEGGQFRFG